MIEQKSFEEVEEKIFNNWYHAEKEKNPLKQSIISGELKDALKQLGYFKARKVRLESNGIGGLYFDTRISSSIHIGNIYKDLLKGDTLLIEEE
jgi:hypothetical protein